MHIAVSRVEFAEAEYKVEEGVGELKLPLVRHGDVSQELAVTCTTHTINSHYGQSSLPSHYNITPFTNAIFISSQLLKWIAVS